MPEGQGHRTAKTNKTTNEFKDKPTSKRYARGGRKSRWRVCVCVCNDGAGSTLQSLVTSVGWQQAQHQNTPTKQEERPESTRQTTTKGQKSKSKRPQKDWVAGHDSLSVNRDKKGESKRRPAAARGRRRQGRQQRTGGEKAARGREVGACSSNGVQRGVPDHPRANTSVQHEDRCHEEKWRQEPSCHYTPYHRHDNRAVARYNQIPGGRDQKTDWTRRPQGTNRGGGQDKGGTLPGGNEPIRSNPKQHKQKTHKTTEEETNNTRQRLRHTRNTTGHQQESTQTKQQPTHQDRQSFFFRPTPDGSRQVVYQAGKTIALCKFTELMQWKHWP